MEYNTNKKKKSITKEIEIINKVDKISVSYEVFFVAHPNGIYWCHQNFKEFMNPPKNIKQYNYST